MDKKCVFLARSENGTYRVKAEPCEDAVDGVMYYTYLGRMRLEPVGWFNREYAIESVLRASLGVDMMNKLVKMY